jgi:nucleotide-binding universal stress UspA family protein
MQINSIVVGMDFSDAAITGALWASECFAPARVNLVHVIDPPDRPRFAQHVLAEPETVVAVAREYAQRRMNEITSLLKGVTPQSEIRIGKAYEQVVAFAREMDADLVVVGPHGNRPRTSGFLGTTAERIVRTSPVSVLVATDPLGGYPRNILVPVDDFSITATVLAWARMLAERFDAHLTLLHVWSNAEYSYVASMAHATAASDAEARREIDKDLNDASMHWLNELARTGIERDRVTSTVTYGHPGDATLELAAKIHADLVVLGKRGSGLVAPALLGSTVGTVLQGAQCPVLVVTESPGTGDAGE